jgi:hypothetical protein
MNEFDALRARQSEIDYCVAAVIQAVTLLLSRDTSLLAIGTHEQGICHRLAVYLEPWFSTYNVDCEYNRMESKVKRVLVGENREIVKPDVLVHERLTRNNCLAIEAKATSNPESKTRPVKLMALTKDPYFKYRLALFLIIDNAKEQVLERKYIEISGEWFSRERLEPFSVREEVDKYTLAWVAARDR